MVQIPSVLYLPLCYIITSPSCTLGLSLPNIPTPSTQRLHDLWRHSRRQRYSNKHKALVDGISENQLCPDTCQKETIDKHLDLPTRTKQKKLTSFFLIPFLSLSKLPLPILRLRTLSLRPHRLELILDESNNDMLIISNALNTKQPHSRKTEWEIQRRQSKIHSQRSPSILPRELLQPLRQRRLLRSSGSSSSPRSLTTTASRPGIEPALLGVERARSRTGARRQARCGKASSCCLPCGREYYAAVCEGWTGRGVEV